MFDWFCLFDCCFSWILVGLFVGCWGCCLFCCFVGFGLVVCLLVVYALICILL